MTASVNRSELQVSVIVPAYNAARTLAATLGSAMAQTIRDIEIIVIDDGSTDATSRVLADLAAYDARLQVIAQSNAGVSATRNAGIARARANTFAFLDADDLWPVHHLETHLAVLAGNPSIDVSYSVTRFIDEAGAVVGAARPNLTPLSAAQLLRSNPTSTTSSWVTRRRAFESAGCFDTTLARSEDQAWLISAALAGLCIRGTRGSIVDYRISSTGLASDLAGMRRGFVAMLDRLAVDHRTFVEKHRAGALASEDLYLARRSLHLALPSSVARDFLLQAFNSAPLRLLATPRATLGVLLRLLAQRQKYSPLKPV